MYSRTRTDNRGQSMLEAIIATGILVTAISSALTLVASSVRASKDSEASITAGNLAREGIEVVRAQRDSNWLAADGRAFDAGLFDATDYSAIAVFNAAANSWSMEYAAADDAADTDARIWRHTGAAAGTTLGLLTQAPAQPTDASATPFSRIVLTEPICEPVGGGFVVVASGADCGANKKIGIRVVSRVRWSLGGRVRTLEAEELMFDWR